jgi:DNA-binding SARP family transcriptional activator
MIVELTGVDNGGTAMAVGQGRRLVAPLIREYQWREPVCLALLGGFAVSCGGDSINLPVSTQRLVAYLALHEHRLTRSHVAATLWPDSTEPHSAACLRSALWRLRELRLLLISATTTHLQLAPGVHVDVRDVGTRARRLVFEERQPEAEDLSLIAAADDLLPDMYDDWVEFTRERLRQLRMHALERICTCLADSGRFGQSVEAGLAAVQCDPLRESARRVLIRAYLAEGNAMDALRQYHAYRQLLHAELAVEPSPELEGLVGPLRNR